MTRALGREVTYVPIDLDEFRAELENRGFGPHIVQHLVNVAIDYRNGVFSGTNDVVAAVTGTPPLTVGEFVTRNKAAFSPARASQGR